MRFFKRYLLRPSKDLEWKQALHDYKQHFESIRTQLPPSAVAFDTKARMHDEVIRGGDVISRGHLRIETDLYVIDFLGVAKYTPSALQSGQVWLYDEIDLAHGGKFECRVLTDEGELSVVASAITMKTRVPGGSGRQEQWVVPPANPPSAEAGSSKGGRRKGRK